MSSLIILLKLQRINWLMMRLVTKGKNVSKQHLLYSSSLTVNLWLAFCFFGNFLKNSVIFFLFFLSSTHHKREILSRHRHTEQRLSETHTCCSWCMREIILSVLGVDNRHPKIYCICPNWKSRLSIKNHNFESSFNAHSQWRKNKLIQKLHVPRNVRKKCEFCEKGIQKKS